MNLERPELNRDFHALLVEGMTRNKWRGNAVHVRKMVLGVDWKLWTAEIPLEDEFPQYARRCILIKRPSLDYFERKNPSLFHAKNFCEATRGADMSHAKSDLAVEYLYHLVYFPSHVVLENAHFQGSARRKVKTKMQPAVIPKNHEDNRFKEDLTCVYVYWDVAFKHGGHEIDSDDDSFDEAKALKAVRNS